MSRRAPVAVTLAAAALLSPLTAVAQDAAAPSTEAKPNDLLNAALWMQESVEYKANAVGIFAFAKARLDAALTDKGASALDQSDAGDKPPAIIIDLDETAIDNSAYESGLVTTNADYSSKTWAEWVDAKQAKAVPGVLDYLGYADGKGVKIFYVSNRTADQEEATRANMQALGFPMGGNVDTFLMNKEKDGWGSDKEARRQFVANEYRVVAMVGDNYGDFTKAAGGTAPERMAAFEKDQAHFTTDWFMLANPTYGSWESTAFGNDYKLSADQKRAMKQDALEPWTPKAAQ
ncbi:5'-nucleotidase, lipoprotein e(P4) family [Mangrovibrevibacter kandeliae]|uniref:5'-nucleotidase, lipoprotein e(P4) family n=1 Tax=Mangrovibrevibacter kandeliae TaxID=2968473 RepID=UPI002118F049|nr:HAD family acid phosphatase [Aurantimonas sp. CSK15Z-1]MCQ8781014.1 5-nucleotide phosphatase [Aurantimonas sp. CSK15Z-1]